MALMSIEHAAKRYSQIRSLQRAIDACDDSIAQVKREESEVQKRLQDLRDTKRDLQEDLRKAARDEGALTLLDVIDALDLAGASA